MAAFSLVCLAGTARAQAITYNDFYTTTTQGIVKLCTAPAADPLHDAAVGYCVGYLVGAFHYYKISEAAGGAPNLVCFGSALPSRREEIEKFVAWAQGHPQYANDLALDSMFRFLGEEHPCP
jgi:hypothetical protein